MPQNWQHIRGTECCDTIIGGRVEIAVHSSGLATGQNQARGMRYFYGIGDARIQPQMFERAAGMTTNGKMWITLAPRLARLVVDYTNDCDSNIWEMIDPKLECKLNFTITEMDRGVAHRFRNAAVVGFAEVNLQTGVITGLEIVTDRYDRALSIVPTPRPRMTDTQTV